MALRRDSLRLRLVPARSIAETGLDPSLYGGFCSPHGTPSPDKEPWSTSPSSTLEKSPAKDMHVDHQPPVSVCAKCQREEGPAFGTTPDVLHMEGKRMPFSLQDEIMKGKSNIGQGTDNDCGSTTEIKQVTFAPQQAFAGQTGFSDRRDCKYTGTLLPRIMESSMEYHKALGSTPINPHNQSFQERMDATLGLLSEDSNEAVQAVLETSLPSGPAFHFVPENRTLEEAANSVQALNTSVSSSCSLESHREPSEGTPISQHTAGFSVLESQKGSSPSSVSSKAHARSRWKRAAHSVKFINHLASNIRVSSTDLIEDRAVDEMMQQQLTQDDAGRVGAAAFEGSRTILRSRSKGRKGMEGLVVKQNRGIITHFQDFYVACLKMPIGHFLVGVLLAPLLLGLFFTPLYLLDVDGLSFNGVVPEDATTNPLVSAKQRCLAFLNIFLYALSLSTTFGGAPVAARSPFCLLVANVNTLLAQFLFVFLSGAVFARMSQPSYPIRCSKKAVIKTDDLLPVLGLEQQEKLKVFAVRLVLTGPSPCELVDAKICLTFRIFVTLPSGSVFCSTQDLEVVRPEVPYLRYGLMVRHIIDKKSPVYGHTMESLFEGDASFSLTVMGLERTSMQPVFHLEDYFVCDDEVIWEGDYEDFIHVDIKGQRILDHSKIDHLKPLKAAARVPQAVARMKHLAHQKQDGKEERREPETSGELEEALYQSMWSRNWFNLRKRKLLKSMSTSFTRADW